MSSLSGLSAPDLIKMEGVTIKYSTLRKKGAKFSMGKWPHRFVILTDSSIYVYADESSQRPNSNVSLIGYNRVKRTQVKDQNFCFSVLPSSHLKSVKEKIFSCTHEEQRKEWMAAIRKQIHVANKIDSTYDELNHKKGSSDEDDERDYAKLEEPVYEFDNSKELERMRIDEDDYDLDEDSASGGSWSASGGSLSASGGSLQSPSGGSLASAKGNKSRPQSIAANNRSSTLYTDGASDVPAKGKSATLPKSPTDNTSFAPGGSKKRSPSDPCPAPPSSQPPTLPPKSGPKDKPQPKYNNLPTQQEDDGLYEVPKSDAPPPPSSTTSGELEQNCFVEGTDRDRINNSLKGKGEGGTYLIRNARAGNDKVLAYLSKQGEVKEFKIYFFDDKWTLNKKDLFRTLDELITHYSQDPLPNTMNFLKQGFHAVKGK